MNKISNNKNQIATLVAKLLNLVNTDNYVSEEFYFDSRKYGNGNVVIFNISCDLVNRFGEDKNVLVYIKFKMKDCKTVVISIHESE